MPAHSSFSRHINLLAAFLLTTGAVVWILLAGEEGVPPTVGFVERLDSGVAASMDSPVFAFGPGWQVSPPGADTSEPAQPWAEPSGRLAFQYTGRELALNLALGDYWGYIFVTVDGLPANNLPVLRGNDNSSGQPSGYKPLYAPEKQSAAGPMADWLVVHRADADGPHEVIVEVWRGWGQTVLRGVAVDALPPSTRPQWPAVLLALAAVWLAARPLAMIFTKRVGSPLRKTDSPAETQSARSAGAVRNLAFLQRLPRPFGAGPTLKWPLSLLLATVSVLLIGGGVITPNWLLTDGGLALLAIAALFRPMVWVGALLFALPFYLYPLPILPGRGLNLIEVGIYGGLALTGLRYLALPGVTRAAQATALDARHRLLFLLAAVALVATFAAEQRAVALREWRTVFLTAPLFALLLHQSLATASDRNATRYGLALAWLAGGALIALAGLWQYATGQNIIQAEGVNRVRAFFGSPNNLALYLERTAAVTLALVIFAAKAGPNSPTRPSRFGGVHLPRWALLLAIPQLIVLLLTFSKGAIFLGLPAMLVGLAVAGRRLLGVGGRRLPAWWGWGLAAVAVGMGLGLLPFLGAERFRSLLDFGPESTGGIRLNLWWSSAQMALDNFWLGVGPDNFLYSYRSGYILPAAWRDPSLNHPHNILLDWWTRIGLPGLVIAAAWLSLGLRSLWRAAKADALAVGALGAIAAALGHGLIDASFALPDLMLVWVLLLHLFQPSTHQRPTAVGRPSH